MSEPTEPTPTEPLQVLTYLPAAPLLHRVSYERTPGALVIIAPPGRLAMKIFTRAAVLSGWLLPVMGLAPIAVQVSRDPNTPAVAALVLWGICLALLTGAGQAIRKLLYTIRAGRQPTTIRVFGNRLLINVSSG